MRKRNLKSVRLLVFLGVMAMVVALAGGCAGPSRPAPPPSEEVTPPAEKPAPATEEPTRPAEEGELIRLKCQVPCEHIKGEPLPGEPLPGEIRWINSELEKRTNGGLKLEIDWGISYGEAIRAGAVDTGIVMANAPEVNPFQAAPCVSILRSADLETGESAAVYIKLVENFPEAQREVEIRTNQKWLAVYDVPACGLVSTKEITSIKDMKGLSLPCRYPSGVMWHGVTGEYYEAIGARRGVIGFASVDVPIALGFGMLDAAVTFPSEMYKWKKYYEKRSEEWLKAPKPPAAYGGYKLYCDARKYFIARTLAGSAPLYAWTINMDVFNELPSEYQKVLVDVGKESMKRYPAILRDAEAMSLEKLVKEQGVNVIELTPEEIAEWQTKVNSRAFYETYVRSVEYMGYANAREVLDGYCELLNFKP